MLLGETNGWFSWGCHCLVVSFMVVGLADLNS